MDAHQIPALLDLDLEGSLLPRRHRPDHRAIEVLVPSSMISKATEVLHRHDYSTIGAQPRPTRFRIRFATSVALPAPKERPVEEVQPTVEIDEEVHREPAGLEHLEALRRRARRVVVEDDLPHARLALADGGVAFDHRGIVSVADQLRPGLRLELLELEQQRMLIVRDLIAPHRGRHLRIALHAIGMAVMVGLSLVIDLRLLGWFAGIPVPALQRFFGLAWLGFGVNTLSGSAPFSAQATSYIVDPVFMTKIVLVFLGAITAAILQPAVAKSGSWPGGQAPGGIKVIAALAIVIWLGAIVTGRLTAYL